MMNVSVKRNTKTKGERYRYSIHSVCREAAPYTCYRCKKKIKPPSCIGVERGWIKKG